MKTLVNGTPSGNPDFPASNLDYDPSLPGGAPDLADVEQGHVAVSAQDRSPLNSPYTPALGSPGPGSFDALRIVPGAPATGHSGANGSLASPHRTSALIAQQCETADVPGATKNLTKGKSGA